MSVRFLLFFLSLEHESIFSNMDNVQKQRENVVGKSSVSCPLKPSDSAPLKHSTMPP